MVEWIAIVVTTSPGLIQDWKGDNVVHVRGFKSKQHCEAEMRDIKRIAPNVPLTLTCVQRRKFRRWKPKPS